MTINFHRTTIPDAEISARSLSAGGAMAMLRRSIDLNNIWMSNGMLVQ
jgi:hypothetical protein